MFPKKKVKKPAQGQGSDPENIGAFHSIILHRFPYRIAGLRFPELSKGITSHPV
jgi:hypothetical protein